MLLRYASSIGAGVFVTAGLIFWMQLLIDNSDVELPPRTSATVWLISKVIPLPPPKLRTPPPPPVSVTTPPLTTPPLPPYPITGPTTARVAPERPATPPGPPSPSERVGGRQGPWIEDAGLMLLARISPNYPHRALTQELEGSVVVEFTITRQGSVTDVAIVESTHPMFEAAAAAAIAKSRYRPRIVNGAPVETRGLTTEVEFRLED